MIAAAAAAFAAAAPSPVLAGGWSLKTLYRFCKKASCADGAVPRAGLVMDDKGNLYGTTAGGGANYGTVFEVTRDGGHRVLHVFCTVAPDCADGAVPLAGLTLDKKGDHLFGTTTVGGDGCAPQPMIGCGTVFEVRRDGTERVLYSFCAAANCADGGSPVAGLIMDEGGDLYGTTSEGGTGMTVAGTHLGTVFKLTRGGSERVLYSFCSAANCADGASPVAGLVLDGKDNVYGTTFAGGANCTSAAMPGCGAVFEVTHDRRERVLYSFCSAADCADGANPASGLVISAKGHFYGMTAAGGIDCAPAPVPGCGTVFKVTHAGAETVLDNIRCSPCSGGIVPQGGLVVGKSGNLYGTTSVGGENHAGTVFRVSRAGDLKVLYSFCSLPRCSDGSSPNGGLVIDQSGNLYGTTAGGGAASDAGTVFELVHD